MNCVDALSKIDDYIENRLSGRELEEFLEHVETCKECYDELEIHYIIKVGMKYLDEENSGSYNIPQMLRQELRQKKEMLQKRKIKMGILCIVMIVAGIALAGGILVWIGHFDLPALL